MAQQNTIFDYFQHSVGIPPVQPLALAMPMPAPPTAVAPAPQDIVCARKLVKAFMRAARANVFVDFQAVVKALPHQKYAAWSEVFTPGVLKELWPLFSCSLQRVLGKYRWRTCSTFAQFERICKPLGPRPFGELGEHVSHTLLRFLHKALPDGAKSSRVKGQDGEGFDLDWQVDAGSLLEDLEIDGEGEVKSMRVHECHGTPDAAFRSSRDFSHKYQPYQTVVRGKVVWKSAAPCYNCLCVSQRINRGIIQRTDSSFLVNLIVCPDGGGTHGLTLRLSGKMSASQRRARKAGKLFVIAPEDKYTQDHHFVGRSLGMRGLEEKLDEHSRVLIRII